MTQGELEKRIKYNTKNKGTVHTYCVDKPILLDWIDEAKKDFPKASQRTLNLENHIPVSIAPYYNPLEIEKWVEKWFGK